MSLDHEPSSPAKEYLRPYGQAVEAVQPKPGRFKYWAPRVALVILGLLQLAHVFSGYFIISLWQLHLILRDRLVWQCGISLASWTLYFLAPGPRRWWTATIVAATTLALLLATWNYVSFLSEYPEFGWT